MNIEKPKLLRIWNGGSIIWGIAELLVYCLQS